MKPETRNQVESLLRKLNEASTTHGRILSRLQSGGVHKPGRVTCTSKVASVSSRIRLEGEYSDSEKAHVALHEAAKKLEDLLGFKFGKLLLELSAPVAEAVAPVAATKPVKKAA